eukprot:31490-Pelagococcus_subviridis.AAC.24
MPFAGREVRRGGSFASFLDMSASISAIIFPRSAAMRPLTIGSALTDSKKSHSAPFVRHLLRRSRR